MTWQLPYGLLLSWLAWGIAIFKKGPLGINNLTRQNIIFLCLSGLATGLSWVFYFKALQTGKVSQVAPVDKLSVAIAIVLAAIFLGEKITLMGAIGAILIIAGTVVLVYAE